MAFLRYKFTVTATLITAICGCTQQHNSSQRAQCLATAIKSQPQLSNAVAVFDDADGKTNTIADGNWANLKLRLGLKFSAASLTKPIIAKEIKNLIDSGKINADSRVIDLLQIDPSAKADPRLSRITVRHLLQHTAGFDRTVRGDPLWNRESLEYPLANCTAAADYVLSHPVNFNPGDKTSYSNAGYCVLGKILASGPWSTSKDTSRLLKTPLGAAGGWTSTPRALHARLKQTLPPSHFPGPNTALDDGSHYDYAWRHWPEETSLPWTHFGRLPGLLNVAATDGKDKLLIVYFSGDPADVDSASLAAAHSTWKCMQINQ